MNKPWLLPAAIVGIVAVLIFAFVEGVDWDNRSRGRPLPSTAPGAIQWSHTRTPRIRFANPRKIPVDDRGYGAQIISLVLLDHGSVVSPVVEVERPYRGFMDSIKYEMQRETPLRGVGEGDVIGLPVDKRVRKYILLVRGLSEKTDWRVFELDRLGPEPESWVNDFLDLPDLSTLPKLQQRPDADALWEAYERAEQDYAHSHSLTYRRGSWREE